MQRRLWTGTLCGIAFLVLILDAKTALQGAYEGLNLCIQAVIPSLFPFFVLSVILTNALIGRRFPILWAVRRFCGMPDGSESLLVVGLLGGYPTGAQAVAQAYQTGRLERQDALRLLGFCSNAGPAFLFGMIAPAFGNLKIAWCLWAVHIASALLTGFLLPGDRKSVV